MSATKQEFIIQVTKDLGENYRRILGSHGIPMPVLRRISERPDVLAKLANILFTFKRFKIGAKGLRKNPGLSIKGYKNFMEFKKRVQGDIDNFISVLDGQPFSLDENGIVIIIRPEQSPVNVDWENPDSIATEIVHKPSVYLELPKAVGKSYDLIERGAYFLVVLWADFLIRPLEEAKAKRFAPRNARILVRRTPQKVKAELTERVKSRLNEIYNDTLELEQKRIPVGHELKEYRTLGKKLGTNGISAEAIIRALNRRKTTDTDMSSALNGLSPDVKQQYQKASRYAKQGNVREAKKIFNTLKSNVNTVTHSGLENLILNGNNTNDDIITKRSSELSGSLAKLESRLSQLQEKLKTATPEERVNLRSLIHKTNKRVQELRTREGIYKKPIEPKNISKAQRTYKNLNAKILANVKQGIGIKEALNDALAEIDATPQQKLELKQHIIQEVTSGVPVKYATQQATQKVLGSIKEEITGGRLVGSKRLKEIIEAL
jgi:hypothetical protein